MESKHIKTVLNIVVYAVGILILCIFGPKLLSFFMPLVIGWIIAMIANPLVKFFEKRLKIVRKHGSWIVIVVVLGAVITICYFVMAWLVDECMAFVKNVPAIYAAFVEEFEGVGNNLSNILKKFPGGIDEVVTEFFVNIDKYIGEFISNIGLPTLSFAGDIAMNIPNLIVVVVFTILSAYFFVADKEIISAGLRKIMPESFFDGSAWLKSMFSKAVGGYLKAQFKIMGVIATILFAGFLILRVDYAILWALLIALLDFLPFFGTGTVIGPWAIFELLAGNYSMMVGLAIIYFVCLLVHQLLQPKFIGDTVGMGSMATLIFMFMGYRLGGVLGMIVAVPFGIILTNLYKEGAFNKIIGDVKALVKDFNDYRKS